MYFQEIPQSQFADQPMAPRGRDTEYIQQVTTRHQQTEVHESITKQDRNNITDPQKKHHLVRVSKIFYWRA